MRVSFEVQQFFPYQKKKKLIRLFQKRAVFLHPLKAFQNAYSITEILKLCAADSQYCAARKLKMCQKNFNSTKVMSNFLLFLTRKKLTKLSEYALTIINLTITSTSGYIRQLQCQPQPCVILTKIRFLMILCRGQTFVTFVPRAKKV